MAIVLQSNALTNLYMLATNLGGAGVKDSFKLVASTYTSGSCIQWINSCSDEFANKVGFPLFSGSLQNYRFEGNDASEHYVAFAVEGFSDVHIYDIFYLEGPAPTDVVNVTSGSSAYGWQYETDTGLVRFTDGSRFHSHPRDIDNWWIRYHYGLNGGAVPADGIVVGTIVPADIQWAIAMMVKRKINLHQQMGMTGGTTGAGNSVTYNPDFVPREVQEIINKYRRYV
ncbi:hypothetical protein LCGC14_2492260 [marine sediment metagenome]|uniref:Uncharacterized protein n=1 Tax=marine sediment metagenome TaxID=412755 RepID=A0A0F9B4G8_9ZZZZ